MEISKVKFSLVLALLTTILTFGNLGAKDGYNIEVTVKDCKDSVAYLCNYYGKQSAVYKVDSVKYKPGTPTKFTLKSDKPLTGGIYMILFSDRATRIEFLLNNGDDFKISFDFNDIIPSAKFTGSKDNTNFYVYQNFIYSISKRHEAISSKLASCKTKSDSLAVGEELKPLEKELEQYRRKYVATHGSSLSGKIINAMMEVEIPEGDHFLADGVTKDSLWPARYYREHYWDAFDFQDNRLIYAPIYDAKLTTYFKTVAPQPDSINKHADMILSKARGAKDVFKYSLWWLAKYTEGHKVMGVDESFVYLVENYFMRGDAFWLHDTMIKKYEEAAAKIAPNMLKRPAQEIRLPDIDGEVTALTDEVKKQDYTLLVFFSADCGHCKKEVPALDSALATLNAKGIDIKGIAIHTSSDTEMWRKFIADKKLGKVWKHLHDPMRIGTWRKSYNVYSTPVVYVIDRKGIIVGKRIDHTNIGGLLEFLEKKRLEDSK